MGALTAMPLAPPPPPAPAEPRAADPPGKGVELAARAVAPGEAAAAARADAEDRTARQRKAVEQGFHRQLRIKADTLAPFLEFVDPNTRAIVLSVPLELARTARDGGDIVIGRLDLII